MKSLLFSFLVLIFFLQFSYSQNTFPSSGNVGIGTTSPRSLLELAGGSLTNNWIFISNTGSYGSTLNIGTVISDHMQESQIQYQNIFGIWDKNSGGVPFSRLYIDPNGNIGIGTTNPGAFKMAVKGNIHAQQVNVDLNSWSDYVFNKNYSLPSLSDVKTYIDQNHHLSEIPSEQEITKDGLNLGEMNKLLVKKVEELTLYLIEKDKQLTEEQAKNLEQENKLNAQQKQLSSQQTQINLMKHQIESIIKQQSK